MNTIPISYGMNGPWSAILRGVYKEQSKKKNQMQNMLQSFINEGNLENHMKYKHARYPVVSSKKLYIYTESNFCYLRKQNKRSHKENKRTIFFAKILWKNIKKKAQPLHPAHPFSNLSGWGGGGEVGGIYLHLVDAHQWFYGFEKYADNLSQNDNFPK